MYYSVNQPPPTISQQSSQQQTLPYEPLVRQQKRRLYLFIAVVTLVAFGGGSWWYSKIQSAIAIPSPKSKVQISPTPAQSNPEVAGVSFGDLLKKQRSYEGWLSGVKDGNIVIMNPQSGEMNTLTSVESQWLGPISPLSWSPDRTKFAYLLLPNEEAKGFASNPQAQAKKMGLESVPTPQTFPFGQIAVLDINTKQITYTKMEVRNTPKNVVWLDDNRLAAITSGLTIFNLSEKQLTTIAGAGITDEVGQLQSPLIWDAATESIYYTRVKKTGDQAARVVMSVSLTTNATKELTILSSGPYDNVTSSRNIDMALDSAGERLVFIGEHSLSYINIKDGGVHALPTQDDWLWLKGSILSDLEWLSPSRVAFASLGGDGLKVWVVWDIPESRLATFGKGMDAGSWDKASGRLALLNTRDNKLSLLTPNWQDTLSSTLENFDLPWQSVTW